MEKEGGKEGRSRVGAGGASGGRGRAAHWTLFSCLPKLIREVTCKNPSPRVTLLLSHCSRLGKRAAPIKRVIFMRKENLKWSSRVHRAFYTGSDPAVRESSS